VEDGTTVSDWDPDEQKREFSVNLSIVPCEWNGHKVNVVDAPGYADFMGEVKCALRAADLALIVVCGASGVQVGTEFVWQFADEISLPRAVFINRMDRENADFNATLEQLRANWGQKCVPLQIPIGSQQALRGVVDLLTMKAYVGEKGEQQEVPSELADEANAQREKLVEAAAETDDALIEKYLGGEELTEEELANGLRAGIIAGSIVPVLTGSATKMIGLQALMEAIGGVFPSPTDLPVKTDGEALKADPSGPLAALVFKVVMEKPVDLYYLRIYSGTLKPNMRLLNAVTGRKENITRIFRMFAKRREQLDRAFAGDIVAVIGPKSALTGHTLCDQHRPLLLESIKFPETVISVSVEPRSSKDRDKLLEALAALERQDPTVSVAANPETGQTLISGMGELHLEIVVQRLRSDMNVDAAVGKPRVSYRETVTASGEGKGRFIRQLGSHGHFAVVRLRIEPRAHTRGRASFEIGSVIPDRTVSPEFMEAMEAGITEAAQSGTLGGYPVTDWKITLLEVELHRADSSELALENAARMAFYEAMAAAEPILLEPIMDIEIVTSDEYFGPIMSDLNSRKAVVRQTRIRGSDRLITADVPLAQMFGYITKLRSLSQGRATSTMTPSHYAPVPPADMKALVG